ncbi:37ee4719-9f85-4a29-b0fe-3773cc600a22 [Sclerotinia trifoliorum]|uniref:37ee4719-9f85-4a29-b0fe-3773cc600a22 n=1 Tax=Sclerotinia trifoliorum TaxID=28548 RepID=A0A8H2VYJ3_9HELO|nr:37ee4719-9f85-4a29-b0fe-3773cc600a22 [Sclerotinia trifoliorum]
MMRQNARRKTWKASELKQDKIQYMSRLQRSRGWKGRPYASTTSQVAVVHPDAAIAEYSKGKAKIRKAFQEWLKSHVSAFGWLLCSQAENNVSTSPLPNFVYMIAPE